MLKAILCGINIFSIKVLFFNWSSIKLDDVIECRENS